MIKVIRASFEGSNMKIKPDRLPEIVLLGRSNVGKSSLLNRLANQKNLARVSKTPGRTQDINSFILEIEAEKKIKKIRLIDLPGFGFANVSKNTAQKLENLIRETLEQRETLAALFLLNDCRRVAEDEEIWARDTAFSSDVTVTVIATKCDKLSNNEKAKMLKNLSESYGLERDDILISGEKVSIEPILRRMVSVEAKDVETVSDKNNTQNRF